jgi:hypothetical protein
VVKSRPVFLVSVVEPDMGGGEASSAQASSRSDKSGSRHRMTVFMGVL